MDVLPRAIFNDVNDTKRWDVGNEDRRPTSRLEGIENRIWLPSDLEQESFVCFSNFNLAVSRYTA